jgi:hypothetical protein
MIVCFRYVKDRYKNFSFIIITIVSFSIFVSYKNNFLQFFVLAFSNCFVSSSNARLISSFQPLSSNRMNAQQHDDRFPESIYNTISSSNWINQTADIGGDEYV